VILALMALTKTAQYYLARYELAFSRRGFVDGASYTDVKAQLPALNLLMIISIAAAALFIANIFRKGWVFPIIAVGLWGFISLVVGTIYPAVIQRVVVQPNEFSREEPYIERNITATRAAFGLDEIDLRDFAYAADLEEADVQNNAATLENIRLWDPPQLREVYRATQEQQTFYAFSDVDVDRYQVGAEEDRRQSMIALRELDESNIPDRTWTNRHLVYTHGFGPVASAANEVNSGQPSYLVSDIPPQGELADGLEQPGIYFGEGMSGYAVVDTKVAEQQAAATDGTEETRYSGDAGVEVSSFLRRSALALRFGDWNLFVSGPLEDNSRVLYKRDVKERVETAAPFLHFDADPYPVVLDGRTLWVIDAYTLTDRYPYSQSLHPVSLPDGSGLDTSMNYVRNSVKATVDAYDGTIRFYVVDEDDPIIAAYRGAFPELFTDASEMPEGLREHWRYPEDLFRTQTEQFAQYHMTDPSSFFRRQFLWDVAPRPERGATTATTPTTTATGNDGGRSTTLAPTGTPIEPLYLTMALPQEESPQQEFVLMRPYVPRGKPNQLSAFMVARSDGDNYGELVVYELPENEVAPSPAQAATLIESEQSISEQFTPLDLRGSQIIRGNVQLIPIDNAIVYARPIYVLGQGEGQFPRLRFVAVAYDDDAVLVDLESRNPLAVSTIDQAMRLLLAGIEPEVPTGEPIEPEDPDEPEEPTEPSEPGEPSEPLPDEVDALLAEAQAEFDAADDALAAGGADALAEYQRHVERARELVERANELLAEGGSGPTTTTSSIPIVGASG
jgi:uncharacterized membrane protein (UPF0182 family)